MPEPTVTVRFHGRLWVFPRSPLPVQGVRAVLLMRDPDAIQISVDGGRPWLLR